MVLVLSERDVSSILTMADGVRLVEDAFREYARGEVIQAPRLNLVLPGTAGACRAMTASINSSRTFGLKTLTGYPGRRAPDETYFTILLFDSRDGALRAVMAGNHITGIRTGAASGVAARYLARANASIVGLFGAGVQARQQVAAMAVVRPLELVKVYDVDAGKAAAFARAIENDFGIASQPVANPRDVVAGSDLVITATTSNQPVFKGEWLEPGTHTSGVGANAPTKRELDDECFRRSKVIVDFRQQVLDEAGDLQAAMKSGAMSADRIHAEMADIVIGRVPGRVDASEITLFKSVGVALEDVATASFVYEQALALGVGTPMTLHDGSSMASTVTGSTAR
jgi:ornithine cyclodeaminase/alanine dehydrogenase-like protein (mu-crystallin family)